MNKTEDGIFLTNNEVNVIESVLEHSEKLVREGLHNLAVELDGRRALFPKDHVFREKGYITIDYRVTEDEVIDNISCARCIINNDIKGINKIFKSTTSGELYDNLTEFKDIFKPKE